MRAFEVLGHLVTHTGDGSPAAREGERLGKLMRLAARCIARRRITIAFRGWRMVLNTPPMLEQSLAVEWRKEGELEATDRAFVEGVARGVEARGKAEKHGKKWIWRWRRIRF